MRFKILFYLIIYLALTITVQAGQLRGLWVVRHAITSPTEWQSILDMAEELQITDLYVQVRALGQRYGLSSEPNQPAPLRNLIYQAKLRGIRVHAWLNVLYIWAGMDTPRESNHLFHRSQSSILRSIKDTTLPGYNQYRAQGIEGYYIDPADTQNLLDLKILIAELIHDYEVDGIHLDYIRYPGFEYSFSPSVRTHFMVTNWFDPADIYSRLSGYSRTNSAESFLFVDKLYRSVLKEKLNKLVATLFDYCNQFDKKIQFSLAVKPNRQIARDRYFQDWGNWLENNICDQVLLMNYQTDFEEFRQNIREAKKTNHESQIVVGVSTYNQDYTAVLERIRYINSTPLAGFALFSYNHLREHKDYYSKLSGAMR